MTTVVPSHITHVTLKNIRGYDCTVELGQVNLAFGQNEAGKTSLLNAIAVALWGMINTEFSGWTKDKGTIVKSLVADEKRPASIDLRHADGSTSKWSAKPKKEGGAAITHAPSPCVEPRGKEDLVRKILGATSPSARAGARKRFVEVFDTGIDKASVLMALPKPLHKVVEASIDELNLQPTEIIEGLIGEFKARIKDSEAGAPAAGGRSYTPADLRDVTEAIATKRARRSDLNTIIAHGTRYEAAQALGDIAKARANLKDANEQVAIHTEDLADLKAKRDEEMAASGFSDFDQVCKDAAEAHIRAHLDGACHVCGAEASREDFDAALAEIIERGQRASAIRAKFGQEILAVSEDLERWKAAASRLKGEVDTLSRAGDVAPPEIPLAEAEAEKATLDEEITSLLAEEKVIKEAIDYAALAAERIATIEPMRQALTALIKLRDDRFNAIVSDFCGKITAALPDGWRFEIGTDDGEFVPTLIRGTRRIVDPTGAQAAILVAAMRSVSSGDPIDIAGERDYSPGHLHLNLLGMTKAPTTQFFVQSTTLPDRVTVLEQAGVTFLDVESLRGGA